jgi:hypothetical protein
MMIERFFVLYDARARTMGSDETAVLVTADTEEEARSWNGEFGEGTCWYELTVVGGKGTKRHPWQIGAETPRPDLDRIRKLTRGPAHVGKTEGQ